MEEIKLAPGETLFDEKKKDDSSLYFIIDGEV